VEIALFRRVAAWRALAFASRAQAELRPQAGFTIIELLIALTVLLVGLAGVLRMQLTALHASAYARHATAAAVLAEDKIEELITQPFAVTTPFTGTDGAPLNERGEIDGSSEAIFDRTWLIEEVGDSQRITVTVRWLERGLDSHQLAMQALRSRR
jgi:prepilin-type N-terminal cleavage/methylation domain-containing protein